MNDNQKPEVIADDIVVSLDYTLTVDGQVIDTSKDSGPIQFIQGTGEIIQGLEREINGMHVHESKDITVSAAEGYGEVNPEAILEIPRNEFPANVPAEAGTPVQVKDAEGNSMEATIVSVDDKTVELDFNHPLAGKELNFHVTVLDLRDPTPEEKSHGHVHSDHDGHFHAEGSDEDEALDE